MLLLLLTPLVRPLLLSLSIREKDPDIRQWIPLVEDYLRLTAPADYLSYASSYLAGKPRVYFMGQYDAYRAAHANADPPDGVRAFLRRDHDSWLRPP